MAEDFSGAISSIEEIIDDARNGKMYILVDAEDRENEGDIIAPAQFATPEAINFMVRYARGLVCLAMTGERANALNLDMMTRDNRESMSTAFTVSIEAATGVTTGISAHDRSRTVQVAIDPMLDHNDIVSPGHIFPLVARDGGTLVRAGHTEAAVDISRMAGLYPAGVICEIMNDDGSMARMPELVSFAQLHGLKIGTIADLIAWRRKNDRYLERRVEAPLESEFADGFKTVVFRNNLDGTEHIALVKGDITPDTTTLVRVHRLDLLSDLLSAKGPREGMVKHAMQEIAAHDGPGVIVFVYSMTSDVMATRLGAKAVATKDPTTPLREYGVGAQILRDLGVCKMVFLSDTAPTRLAGLDGYGLSIEGWRPLNKEVSK